MNTNIWAYLALALVAIGLITSIVVGINTYIDRQVELQYTQKVADFMLQKQNQAILDYKIPTELFKKKTEIIYQTIEKKVPVYVEVKGDCQEQLDYVNSTLKTLWN